MSGTAVFDLAWVASVVGFFLPLLISFVKQSQWPNQLKRSVALGISIVAGIATVAVQRGLVFDKTFVPSLVLAATDVYVVSSVTYRNFWQDTAVERALESVGSKDTPSSPDTI